MPRHKTTQNQNQDRKSRSGDCKIRKRVSSSSSSSAAVNKNYRLKRALLVGKSPGSTTPVAVPTWKLTMAGSGSPFYRLHNFENDGSNSNTFSCNDNNNINIKGKEVMSARKLAATLWEINGLHSPVGLEEEIFEKKRGRKNSDAIADPTTPVCDQRIDRSKVGGHRRRSSAISQKHQITEYTAATEGLETVRKLNSIEVVSHMPGQGENNVSVKTRLKDVNNSLIASKELVKVLFRILSEEEEDSSKITLVSALRVELDRARLQVGKLMEEQRRFDCNQRDALRRQFAEEKAGWKSRERERIRETVSSLAREVEIERKLRRQAERLNKKLGMELAEARAHWGRAMKEVEGERRAREALEETCDELATGIGEEREAVEELKREAAKAREEVEKERQMLQVADVLREERVQMKLAEARYEYEEKTAALERLRTDIINASYGVPNNKQGHDGGDGDSGESELHSIELNMDNNSQNYRWSFAGQSDSRRASTSLDEEVFKGRRSLSDQVQWESICLQRNASHVWDFTNQPLQTIHGLFAARSSNKDEFKRNATTLGRSSTSPANSSPLREACTAILQDLASRRDPVA